MSMNFLNILITHFQDQHNSQSGIYPPHASGVRDQNFGLP